MSNETQDDIIKLTFPDCVRTRPGMYIGGTETADVLLREIIDNSIDECYKCKTCNTIIIKNDKNSGLIIDNGRGIPIKKSLTEEDLTMAKSSCFDLHSGSKFNKTEAAVGQNGVGSSVCVALSNYHILAVRATDKMIKESTTRVKYLRSQLETKEPIYYLLVSEKGIMKEELLVSRSEISKYIRNYQFNTKDIDIGTLVYFEPDDTVFGTCKMHLPDTLRYFKCIANRLYGKKVSIIVNDKEYTDSFKPYEMEFLTKIKSFLPDVKNKEATFLVSCKFNQDFDMSGASGSINGLIVNQGYHINLVRGAFRQAYDALFSGIDYQLREEKGIEFSVICLCAEPEFSSQTKERCVNIDGISRYNAGPMVDAFTKLIKKNYEKFALHNKKLVEFINSIKDLSRIEFIKSKVPVIGLDGERKNIKLIPNNVKTCSSSNRAECDLFIVEGRSAAGSVIKARDSRTQAVMALRGKPMNGAGLDIVEILNNEELKDLIATIGTGIDERFSLDKVNYGKIIITADADPDGANIASLVLGLFFSHMKYLIRAGMVYICECPLFKQGDRYFYDGEFDQIDKSKPFQRYKGLGELNLDDVKATITDQNQRRLVRVTDDEDDMDLALKLITTTYARKQLLMDAGIINEDYLLTAKEIGDGKNS